MFFQHLFSRKYHNTVLCLLILCSGYTIPAAAQLKDCNAFIKGNYLEMGVNYNGAYGSSVDAPSGYHPRGGSILAANGTSCTAATTPVYTLGFVADPAKDGWSAGTPNYYGDFFVPGTPQEGWSIMTEKMEQVNCWNAVDSGKYAGGMTGSNMRVISSGGITATEWEGIYDSLLIIQRTIMNTANTYFVTRVKIRNLAHRTRKDIYYLRTLDPDNDQTLPGGDFGTDNRIVAQNPNADSLSIVSAIGLIYPEAYLAMGTKDLRARCFITRGLVGSSYERLHPNVRIDSLYAGIDTLHFYHSGDSLKTDVSIGIVFHIDSLATADSTVLAMSYIFGGKSDISKATADKGLLPGEKTPTTDLYQPLAASTVSISPNPFDRLLQISGITALDKILLYTLNGIVVPCNGHFENGSYLMQTEDLPSGTYLLTVTNNQGLLQHRQVVQRR